MGIHYHDRLELGLTTFASDICFISINFHLYIIYRTGFGANHKVAKGNISTVLARNQRAHRSYGARVIEANTTRGFYRRDLAKFAIGRYHALNRAAGLKKTVKKQTRRQAAKAAKAKETAKKTKSS